MLNEENILRINGIDKGFIPHAMIKNVIEKIEKSIFLSKNSREPVNVLMTGIGGVGKTTASNHIVSGRRAVIIKEEDREITTIPAFYTSVSTLR